MSENRTAGDPGPVAVQRSLAEAVRRMPWFRNGKPIHTSTVTRWILKGVRLKDGTILRPAARRFPGGWALTDEAIDAFVEALTRDRCGVPAAVTPTSAARREAIDRELDDLGL